MIVLDRPTSKIECLEHIIVVDIDEKHARTMAMDEINGATVKIYKFIMSNFINCRVSLYPLNLMSYIKLKKPILDFLGKL